jgi:hypothetical protein
LKSYNKDKSNSEFEFVNNHKNIYSHSSNNTHLNLNRVGVNQPTSSLQNLTATSSSFDHMEMPSESLSVASDQAQLKLTTDDFDFLEKITSFDKEQAENKISTKKVSSEKRVKSSKSSSKLSQNVDDESSLNSTSKKIVQKQNERCRIR